MTRRPTPPETEATEAGDQHVVPGVRPLTEADRIAARAARPLARAGHRSRRRSLATTGFSIPAPAPRPISSTSSATANPTQRRPDPWN